MNKPPSPHQTHCRQTRDEAKKRPSHLFAVAPMVDVTDQHARHLYRLISRKALLYTEMITAHTILHHRQLERILSFDETQHPVVIQLGGSEPQALAEAARIAQSFGYDEINLNIGCPSPRVQKGAFGACLMAVPTLVRECVTAIQAACSLPVSIKTRIGIDQQNSDAFLDDFIGTVSEAGVDTFIIHARIALLKGLSPKQNRQIPPLNYDRVFRLKQNFPHLNLILNGGLESPEQALMYLDTLQGVMLGRAVMNQPYLLHTVDHLFFNQPFAPLTEREVVMHYADYAWKAFNKGVRLQTLIRPLLGLFHGVQGARNYRRCLSEGVCQTTATPDLITQALDCLYPKSLE
jgi:tRNA-dihydrouridine synthase A